MSDNPTIAGKGRSILLPPEGNPFDKNAPPPVGDSAPAEESQPRYGKAAFAPQPSEFGEEPMDLTPADIAALYPSSHDDRNAVPGASAEPAGPGIRKSKSSFIPETPPADPAAMGADAAMPPMPTTPPAAEASAPSSVGFQPSNPFVRAATASSLASVPPVEPPSTALNRSGAAYQSEAERLSAAPGPGGGAPTAALPVPPVPEDAEIISLIITDERVKELWARIEAAEHAAVSDENSTPSRMQTNLENLKGARNLLLGGRKNFEDAQRYVAEVEASLRAAERVRRWSYSYGLLVLAYNLAWLAMLAWGYASAGLVADFFAQSTVISREFGFTIWITILSGGLGGVSGALYSLWVHVAKEQDFDRQHMMWYITNPLMGAVLGIFVYMVAQVGIVTLSGGGTTEGNALFILYILAWLAGFQQNVAYKLVQQAMNFILKPRGGEDDKSEENQTLPQAPAPDSDSK